MYQNFIGVDISKADFYVAKYGEKSAVMFPNNLNGFKSFCKKYQDIIESSLVVLETTGGYEMALVSFLCSRGISVHRADTRKVKYFIRSHGQKAKSDAIDAQGLATYGFERHNLLSIYTPLSKTSEQLRQLMERRLDLVASMASEKNRQQAPNLDPIVKKSCMTMIKYFKQEIVLLENKMDALFESEPFAKQKLEVLKEVDGIGDVISKNLLIALPELGTVNRRKIASLAGVAPHPNQSGLKVGYRRTGGGRAQVRTILFMSAMSASKSKGRLGDYYRSLIARGKKKMVAMVALIRKILVIANAKLAEWYDMQNASLLQEHDKTHTEHSHLMMLENA